MSKCHPIIAATGSSGAGTSTIKRAFNRLFDHMGLNVCPVEGDAFHRYDRETMREKTREAMIRSENFSHFGPSTNLLSKLEALFRDYGSNGSGTFRRYIHNEDDAALFGGISGGFTRWESVPEKTDLLFYEGLHGGIVTDEYDIARHADLLLGVVPTINLEWAQKAWRDTTERGYSYDEVRANILRRMPDYINYIVPQFSRTDINFQRVPTIDTSNPFALNDVPTPDESMVVIRFRDPSRHSIDFPYLLSMIHNSFMSRADSIVVPGGKMEIAIQVIFAPLIEDLMSERSRANLRAAYAAGLNQEINT